MATVTRELPPCNGGPQMVRALMGACDGDPASDGLDVAVSPDVVLPFDVAVADAAVEPLNEPHMPTDAELAEALRRADANPVHLPPVPPYLAERVNGVNRLERNWWQLHQNLTPFARLLTAHAFGWVAATDKQYGSDDDYWPAEARFPLRAAGFVLDNTLSILNAVVETAWGETPLNIVRPLVPLVDPDPKAVPADVYARIDKLADLAAALSDVERDIAWCMDDQARMPDFDPRNGPLMHTLTGARLALDIIVREMNDHLSDSLDAALARRKVARNRPPRPTGVPLDSQSA